MLSHTRSVLWKKIEGSERDEGTCDTGAPIERVSNQRRKRRVIEDLMQKLPSHAFSAALIVRIGAMCLIACIGGTILANVFLPPQQGFVFCNLLELQ